MKQRYEWHREHKGAHPRGNLPTPDYQAARAKERQDEYQRLLNESLEKYDERIYELSLKLDNSVERQWKNASNQDIIEQYLAVCPDEAYQQLVNKASDYLSELAIQEQKIARDSLLKKIQLSEEKQRTVKSSTFSESYDTLYR